MNSLREGFFSNSRKFFLATVLACFGESLCKHIVNSSFVAMRVAVPLCFLLPRSFRDKP